MVARPSRSRASAGRFETISRPASLSNQRNAGIFALFPQRIPACPLEVWLLDRPFLPPLAAAAGLALALTMALRYWVIATLGDRWCTRVLVPPGEPRITGGPYRFLRHPNYLAVAVEVFALPLVHTAWLTAAVLGGANLAVLAVRIRAEDRALGAGAAARAG